MKLGVLLFAGTTWLVTPLPTQAADCPVPLQCAAAAVCTNDPRLGAERFQSDTDNVIIKTDFSDKQPNGDILLKDNVEVRQGSRVVRAQEIEYHNATDDFHIPGPVEIVDPNITIVGNGAKTDRNGTAEVTNTQFSIPARAGHGSAAKISLSTDGQVDLRDVRYTTCPTPKPAWELKVGHLHIDQNARVGSGSGVRVDFKGVPILYAPYISFPVGNEPKSGLLAPEFEHSSRSGWKFSLPWYWRINDSYDATLTPSWYSSRGFDAGGELRFLTERNKGQLNLNVLPSDRITGTDRTFAQLTEQTDFTSHLRFRADAINLGDPAWFEDFGGATYTSIVALPRIAELIYRNDAWLVLARAQNFQIIDPQIARANRPFTLLPQVELHGYFPDRLLGLTASIDGEFSAFKRTVNETEGINSQRLDVTPALRLPLRGNGAYLEPAAALRYTTYRLDPIGIPSGSERTLSRSAPVLSLDGGMIFERDTSSRSGRVQTLEPRFLYAYVPYRNQDAVPVFDTVPPDFNLIRLFRTERYAGPDRLGDVNSIALGLTSRLLGGDGGQVLSATVGELYRFAEQRVGLPGESLEHGGSSDVIGELDLTAYHDWNAHVGTQWDPANQRNERTEFGFQYRPAPDRVVNLAYRYRRQNTLASVVTPATPTSAAEGLKQVDGSVAWPIGSSWSVYGRMVYSIKDSSAIERLGGFEYRSCCWGVRLLARRSVSSLTGASDWEIKAQLELTGLSNVGNPVDTFLAESIQGYSAARNDFSSTPIKLPQGTRQ